MQTCSLDLTRCVRKLQSSGASLALRRSASKQTRMATPFRRNGGARRDRTDDILLAKQALSQLSYGPIPRNPNQYMVGPGRLELPTSRLSGVRSNHLSYGPPGIRLDRNLSTAGSQQDQYLDQIEIGVNSRLAGTLFSRSA
jgi:hypothetical protein